MTYTEHDRYTTAHSDLSPIAKVPETAQIAKLQLPYNYMNALNRAMMEAENKEIILSTHVNGTNIRLQLDADSSVYSVIIYNGKEEYQSNFSHDYKHAFDYYNECVCNSIIINLKRS